MLYIFWHFVHFVVSFLYVFVSGRVCQIKLTILSFSVHVKFFYRRSVLSYLIASYIVVRCGSIVL